MSTKANKRKKEGKTFHFGKKKRGRDHSQNFSSEVAIKTTNLPLLVESERSEQIIVNLESETQQLDEEIFYFQDEPLYELFSNDLYDTENESELFVECASIDDESQIEQSTENEFYNLNNPILTNTSRESGCTETQFGEPIELFYLDDDLIAENDFIEFTNEDELSQPDMPEDEENDRQQKEELSKESLETLKQQSIEGNRIVGLCNLFEDIRLLNNHSKDGNRDCNFNDMVLIRETKFGFKSRFAFCCQKCGYLDYLVTSQENDEMPNINLSAVLATLSVGLTYSTLVEFSSVLNIPSMAKSTYYKKERELHVVINNVAQKSMDEVAEIEKQECIKRGSVDEAGNALDLCFIDAAWSKRSYHTSYSASSGAATIIGGHTKKVMWNGVANKRCRVCESAFSAQTEPIEHKCNKNFSGPSTAMEPKLVKDGFIECESKYKIRFNNFVGDGDSSVVVELNNSQIYRYPFLQINKWECCNHLYKALRKALRKLAGKAAFKLFLSNDKIEKIIYYIRCARKHWSESSEPYEIQIENLRKDIFNIPYHLYGDHTRCAPYFCEGAKDGEKNVVPILVENQLMTLIQDALARVRLNARSVMKNENTNIVEQFNSLIVKYTGNKRVDLTSSGSFKARNQLAVIQHNTGRVISMLLEAMGKKPNSIIKHIEDLKIAHNEYNVKNRKNHPKKKKIIETDSGDEFYGTLTCQKLDMDPSSYDFESKRFLDDLARRHEKRTSTERQTTLQEDSDTWKSVKHGMVTSSFFGCICAARNPKSYTNIVDSILYGSQRGVKPIQHNLTYQFDAVEAFKKAKGLHVVKSGFFTDENHNFLGALPYGTIGDNAIIEINCPLAYYGKDVMECVKKDSLWIKDKEKNNVIGMNCKHKEYYKIQVMLHVTNRQLCYYVLWPGYEGIIIWQVEKDDTFWSDQMLQKLTNFFKQALLPEIVNPRRERFMRYSWKLDFVKVLFVFINLLLEKFGAMHGTHFEKFILNI